MSFSAHIINKSTLRSPVMWSFAPHRRPSRSIRRSRCKPRTSPNFCSRLEHTLPSPRFRRESLYTSLQTSMIFQLCKTVCACDQVPRVFLVVEMSKDHWRLTLTAISCQASTWRSRQSRKMRLLHQLDLTMSLKKSPSKLCSVQID